MILQSFCTVQDLLDDAKTLGSDERYLFQKIREASDYLQKEIGWFVPVTEMRRFDGRGRIVLYPGPLLGIDTLTNDQTVLSPSDYILKPDHGMWPNGPYTEIWSHPDSVHLTTWQCEIDGVEITGRWGKYERSGPTGATLADEQSDSQLTLKVADGSKVSPGMTLLVDSEQQVVTGWGAPTASVTTLGAAVSAADEVITVANGSLINVGEVIRVDFEQMKVTDRAGNQLEVVRMWNGTRKTTHANGTAVDVYRTVTVERAVNGTTAASHEASTAIYRYFVPDDILYLCKEIATLMANKALSGFQGRTGNEESGVIFYHDAFPRFDIETVKRNYYIPKGPTR